MSNGLEALRDIAKLVYPQLDNVDYYFSDDNTDYYEKLRSIETELKVLEIIVQKNVEVRYIKQIESYEVYKKVTVVSSNNLNEREFNLLKEVLKNE